MRTGCATSTRRRDEREGRPGDSNMRGHSEPDNRAGTIVGGGRSNGGLWIVRGGEVNNCYLDEVKHLGSSPWLSMTKSKRKVIASGARRIDPWSSTHGSKLQPVSNNCYYVRKRGEA